MSKKLRPTPPMMTSDQFYFCAHSKTKKMSATRCAAHAVLVSGMSYPDAAAQFDIHLNSLYPTVDKIVARYKEAVAVFSAPAAKP